jgi:outer membrane protein assembly factor BamD (BamD/ComL family)
MRCALLVPILAACASPPPLQPENTQQVLDDAQQLLAGGDVQGARDLLLTYDGSQFAQALRPRYEVLLARAHLALDDPWAAFLVLRDFADQHPHSELRDQAVELEFQAGSALLRRGGGFLFFWSDRRAARTCLEHLITRYPNCDQLADSLRLLGEMAMEDRDWLGAEERFRELLRRHPESEWAPLARFRFAMSIVASLRGPEYDLEKMESASKELRAFLDNPPENPTFVAEATAALQRLLAWRAERHLRIAEFYRRVGNGPGEVEHLHAATVAEFAATEAAAAARQRLSELGNPPPLSAGGRP